MPAIRPHGLRIRWYVAFTTVALLLSLFPVTDSPSQPSRHRFSIKYDYRFAGACLASPEARRTLDAVADMYGRLITDDFPRVPAGTIIQVWNDTTEKYVEVKLTEAIDDVLIFVSCANWKSSTKATASILPSPWGKGTEWERRWTQKPFQPWAMRVVIGSAAGRPWFYDPTPESDDDLPSRTHYDLYQTLLHEIGHALGLSRNEAPFVFTDMVKDNKFYGPNAMKWNQGEPVPLEDESSHIKGEFTRGLVRPNIDRYMMHASDNIDGLRAYPKALDLAMLKDIGYHIDPVEEARVLALSAPGKEDPRKAAYQAKHPDYRTNAKLPVGLWYFDDPRYLTKPVVGFPLLYMPPAVQPISRTLISRNGSVLIPKEGFLVVDHGMRGNGGGKMVNQYSIVMDINLPKTGQNYGLYNTSSDNAVGNPAEAFIDDRDLIGQGNYSNFKFRADQWYRVTIVVNLPGERRYYVDGELVLKQAGGDIDQRHSIGAVGSGSTPLFCLLADGSGDKGDILLRSAAIYSYALNTDEAKRLGKTGDPLD